jgi:hypothetical protein
MYGNIAHGYPLVTVTKFTHVLEAAVVCLNFAILALCQLFPFSCSIADALPILIVCEFPRLFPRILITACALAFHVRASDGGASLASRLKSGSTVLTLIMK